jgi:hypothetical protein
VLDGLLPPGGIDEDAAHGLGGGGEEVIAAVEALLADQAQVGLVDQGGRLEGVSGRLLRQLRGATRH